MRSVSNPARTAPDWLSAEALRRILDSAAVGGLLASFVDDPGTPAAVRGRLLVGEEPDSFGDRAWALCVEDTGVWPRVILTMARGAGADPLTLDEHTASDDQRFWVGLFFGGAKHELEGLAPAMVDEAVRAVPTSPESEIGPDDASVAEDADAAKARIRRDDLQAEREALLIRVDEIDDEIAAIDSAAWDRFRDWVSERTTEAETTLRAAADREHAVANDPEIRALEKDLEELLETREAALTHTHSSLRETLRAGYEARATALREDIARRVELADAGKAPQAITVGALWREGAEVVVAPFLMLEGLIEEGFRSALAALRRGDDVPVSRHHAGLAVLLSVQASEAPDDPILLAQALAAGLTEALMDVEEWPAFAHAELEVIRPPGPLRLVDAPDDTPPRGDDR